MSRYQIQIKEEDKPWKIHPIWRGIGVIWIIIILVMSYLGAVVFMENNRWLEFPANAVRPFNFPVIPLSNMRFDLDNLFSWLPGWPLTLAHIVIFFAFLLVGYGLMSILYALLYRMMGPPKNPLDAPEYDQPARRRPR